MFNTRLLSIIRKEFIQIFRDKRTLVLALVFPVVQLFLLGYAATNDVRNVPLAVFDQDRGPAARALLDAFRSADYFRLTYDVNSEAEIRALIDRGDAKAGLVIPPDYDQQLNGAGTGQVAFVLDGSDPTVASTALAAAQQIAQSFATSILSDRLAQRGQPASLTLPIDLRTQVWYNPDMTSAYFMVPALVGMILQTLTSILTAGAVVREHERGTIEQLIVTPIRPWELVVGKLAPFVILALTNTVTVLAIGAWWFKVPVRGDLLLIAGASCLFLVSGLGIGLLASTLANTQQEAVLTVFMTILPSIFLSGFFFPLEAMPPVLQAVSYLVPLRYYLVAIRALMLKGVGIVALQNELIALAIFGAVIMTIAALRVRKRLD
jgi:ABC-2 type transport system permease protein